MNKYIRIGLLLIAAGAIAKTLAGSFPVTEFANGMCVGLSVVCLTKGLLKRKPITTEL